MANNETTAPLASAAESYGKTFFEWSCPEFPRHNRDLGWYIWAVIIVVALEIYAIWTLNFLFGFIAIIAWLTLLLFHRNPVDIKVRITEDGIVVNSKLFAYKMLKDFFIIYQPPEVKTIYFEAKSILNPRIPIALEDQDPVKIRAVLKKYLDENTERVHEPFSDQFSRLLKL